MYLLWLSLAFLAGILLSASLELPALVWQGCAVAVLFLLVLLVIYRNRITNSNSRIAGQISRPGYAVYLLAGLALFLGAARYQAAQPDLADPHIISFYNDLPGKARINGTLVQPPDQRDNFALLTLRSASILPPGSKQPVQVDGLLLARISGLSPWRYGDRLMVSGELTTPQEEEDFSYRQYLATQGIYTYMSQAKAGLIRHGQGRSLPAALFSLREKALDKVYHLWPEPEASLLAGILLGVDSGIPEEVEQAFRKTGTAHIIAISG
jgi:competence protein ComEC